MWNFYEGAFRGKFPLNTKTGTPGDPGNSGCFTEIERFELSRRLPDLPHFECGPFSHLGISPSVTGTVTLCRNNLISIHEKWLIVNISIPISLLFYAVYTHFSSENTYFPK